MFQVLEHCDVISYFDSVNDFTNRKCVGYVFLDNSGDNDNDENDNDDDDDEEGDDDDDDDVILSLGSDEDDDDDDFDIDGAFFELGDL